MSIMPDNHERASLVKSTTRALEVVPEDLSNCRDHPRQDLREIEQKVGFAVRERSSPVDGDVVN